MSKSRSQKRRINRRIKKEARKLAMDVLLNLWLHIRIIIDYIIDFIFGLYYDGKQVKVPPVTNPFFMESATSLATSIRERKLTAEEVITAYIERIKEVNPIINAVTDDRFQDAIEEARKIDMDIANGKITEAIFKEKPFLGVPFTTKESTACKGMLHTFGLVVRRDTRAEEDADIVTLMKNAGGILIAVTNVPELNLWTETRNNVFGQTLNPYNTTRTTGGSSGGEASLLAACGSACGLGTDIGGSIRIPAFFCGIFGHKPTSYLISTKGLTRRTGEEKPTMVVAGPMSRHAEDLTPMLKVMLGKNVDKLRLDAPVNIQALKYFYVEESEDKRTSSICVELRQLMKRVVSRITDDISDEDGVTLLEIPELQYSYRLWRYWMSQEPSRFAYELANREGEVSAWTEACRKLVGMSNYSGGAVFKLLDDKLPRENEKWARETTVSLREKLLSELNNNAVLLYPSFTWPASYHYSNFLRPFNFSYFCILNALHLPATQVPLGLSKEGLPVGIQVVAAPYNDHLCFAVAKYLEKTFGGYVPPFKY